MGVDRKAPSLPAPTESDSTTGGTEFDSRVTGKTSYSLPEDGSPITIATRRRRSNKDGHTLSSNKSQTSLLIEYFEGGKGSQIDSRRPSVRVKVRPSSKIRRRSSGDHIQISERKGSRRASHTKRIQISPKARTNKLSPGAGDDHSLHSYRSMTDESNVTSRGDGQIEVEIMPRRHGSPLIPACRNSRNMQLNPSDISSVPENSFLDGNSRSDYKRNRSFTTGDATSSGAVSGLGTGDDNSKTPSGQKTSHLNQQPTAVQKVVEKVRSENLEQRRRKHSSRSRSVSSELVSEASKSKKKLNRTYQDDSILSGADSSLLNSHLSDKSGDLYSFRPGNSKSSINNPKLLETVEDAIRRLILPELSALKREHSKNTHRSGRGSIASGSGISRDSRDYFYSMKKSDMGRGPEMPDHSEAALPDSKVIPTIFPKESTEEHAIHSRDDSIVTYDYNNSRSNTDLNQQQIQQKTRNIHNQEQGNIATGAASNQLVGSPLRDRGQELLSEENGGERLKSKSHSRSGSYLNSFQEQDQTSMPLPLLNDINPSEITRSSILSAQSDNLQPSDRELCTPICEVPRGIASPVSRASSRTPVTLQQGLGTQHSNYSRGNLSLHSQHSGTQYQSLEYDLDEHGRKVPLKASPRPLDLEEGNLYTVKHSSPLATNPTSVTADATPTKIQDNNQETEVVREKAQYFYQNIQEVPPPLRYTPYAQERRRLSPIYSVSGWTEGDHDNQRSSRMTRSTGSYSSISRSAMQRQSEVSVDSVDSNSLNENFQHTIEAHQSSFLDSEITQDLEYWEEQHKENNRNRKLDEQSYRSFDPRVVDQQNAKGEFNKIEKLEFSGLPRVWTNADFVRKVAGVESAVASIVNESELTGGSGSQVKPELRGFRASFEHGSESQFTAQGHTKASYEDAQRKDQRKNQSGGEVDESGETSKPAENQVSSAIAPLKSFKERAMEMPDQLSLPPQSFDNANSHEELKMGASGIPDLNNPMPEIGFGDADSDVLTNPSSINDPGANRDHWSSKSLSQQQFPESSLVDSSKSDSFALGKNLAGIGETGTFSYDKQTLDHENDEEWQRDSSEQKRDTLITNPYENTSPIAAADSLDQDLARFQGMNDSFIPSKLSFPVRGISSPRDEGYISSAPNSRSPGATPKPRMNNVDGANMNYDPFYTQNHQRSLSGMSHGMGSPIYDSATGNGIDRIQSKDIIALMDHLTVRDAQRSARDTEILVTLVRAAAEMRNSFEDMKRLLADTEDVIITEVQANTEKSVQKVINGPRPPPQSAQRSIHQGSRNDILDDIPAKKRNVFRRALKGLSMKSANDLGKIEEMLVQLLGEVEGLKVAQGLKPLTRPEGMFGQVNRENYETEHDGYEPERNSDTPTASYGGQPDHNSPSRGPTTMVAGDGRKFDDHRISAVPEADEYEANAERNNEFGSRARSLTPGQETIRRRSGTVGTPPHPAVSAPRSSQNTPVTATESCKKHKSSSSSGWIPKVSRWSETTASTVLRGFRSSARTSGRKADSSPPLRSRSDLGNYAEKDVRDADKLRTGFSDDQIHQFETNDLSMSQIPPEDPKFKAHRDSQNLQHPQPRQGPTDRYQTALESQASNFDSPTSQKSIEWGSQASLKQIASQQNHRYIENRSPESDGGYLHQSASNQSRPNSPKGPTTCERTPTSRSKLNRPSPLSNEHNVEEPYDRPRSVARNLYSFQCLPTRRPTGPRTMGSPPSRNDSFQSSNDDTVRVNTEKGLQNIGVSNHDNESETF
ncbi:hypothetical protein K3495_g1761 [Podosphaera aphanis]|nr:hypothetical protein K3495_g1761 [Podosphaera aphanis]